MKKQIFSLVFAAGLIVTLVAPSFAVTTMTGIRADIPFDFNVGKKKMPKGEYTIEANTSGLLTIRSVKKGKGVNVMAIKSKETEKPKSKVIFRRYGDQYFLARIWDGSSETVWKIEKSSTEKKVAKAMKKEENPDEVPVSDK